MDPDRLNADGAVLENAGRFLAAIVDSSDAAIIGKDLQGVIHSWNPGAEALYGYAPEEVIGEPVSLLAPPAFRGEIPEIMERIRRGERIKQRETVRVRKDGRRLDISLTVSPVHDAEGRIIGASAIGRDITAEKRSRTFDGFLARAGEVLNAPLEADAALQRVADLAVGSICDCCVAYLLDDGGLPQRVGVAHVRPEQKGDLLDFAELVLPDAARDGGWSLVRREGGMLLSIPTDAVFARLGIPREASGFVRRLELGSMAVTPVEARGHALGYLALGTVEQNRRPFDEADFAKIREYARRLGLAVENGRLLQRTRASEERLRIALEGARMGTWDWVLDEGVVRWSENLERIHGLEPGGFSGTLEAFLADVHPEDRSRVRSTIEHTVEGNDGEYRVDYRVRRPDGEVRWLSARGAVLRDETGRARRMLGVCTDTTARKKEEAVNRFLSRAGRTLGTSLDLEDTLARLTELTVPELADSCTVDLVESGGLRRVAVAHDDPELGEVVKELSRRSPSRLHGEVGSGAVVRTGEPQVLPYVSEETLRKAGYADEALDLLERVQPRSALVVPLETGEGCFGTLTLIQGHSGRRFDESDLSLARGIASRAAAALENARLYREARETAAQLERERTRLAELFEQVPAFIAVLNGPDHVFDVVNPWYHELVGRRDLVGRPIREVLPELEGQPFLELLDQVYERGEPASASGEQVRLPRGSGGVFQDLYLSFVYQPLFDDGSVSGIFVHGVDVTELVQARKASENAVRSRDEVLAFVSHDLRNFLGIVETGTKAAVDLPLEADQREDVLQRVLTTSQRALRFIDDLLEVARTDSGALRLELEETRPAELVQAATEAFFEPAQAAGVELKPHVSPDVPPVRVDPHRMHRVFSNLLTNALKHTEPGGSVEVQAHAHGSGVSFRVSDTGKGIPRGEQERIFDRYWHGEGSDGSGLGLAIAKTIVEAHGGEIHVESEEGRGSSFVFRIPYGGGAGTDGRTAT